MSLWCSDPTWEEVQLGSVGFSWSGVVPVGVFLMVMVSLRPCALRQGLLSAEMGFVVVGDPRKRIRQD